MVGLVLVSHSRVLAEAAAGLAKGVGKNELPIAFAGGAGDDHQDLGTDATEIMEAITSVNAGDGVLVLMDLGSAVISARLAEQMLADDVPNIRLCPAPLVEGAVAAAIQIGADADIDAVYNEAKNALAAKQQEISDNGDGDGDATPPAADASPAEVPGDALHLRFTIDDPNGMHTRPAAEFIKAVAGFDAEIRIRNPVTQSPFVNARSLTQISLSNIGKGDVTEIAAWGPDAEEVVAAVRELLRGELHGREVEAVPPPPAPTPPEPPDDLPEMATLSPGVAMGTLFVPDGAGEVVTQRSVDDPEAEVVRLDAALSRARGDLEEQRARFAGEHSESADIIDAQILIIDDAEIGESVRAAIRANRQDAASAYQQAMRKLADSYRSLSSAYMRERGADINGVAEQVVDILEGREAPDMSAMSDVILCAPEVTPVQMGLWPPGTLKGILTREGGSTSHIAIIARSLGIPAITGYVPTADAVRGATVAMDASALEVAVNPAEARAAEFAKRRAAWKEQVAQDRIDSQGVAVTRDGTHIPVLANVGDAATARAAAANGAEGIGLLRTEFLFLDRRLPPDEEEQVERLTAIFEPFAGKPVTVRTLDAGGDKPMPWMRLRHEANPFLGVRGVRLMEKYPDLFKTQLRAILRAGKGAALEIMVPMIATLEEVAFCRQALDDCHADLTAKNIDHCWPVRFGVMVETPSAALMAERIAAAVDFLSIGTNDLTQYVMCAERGAKGLAALSDPMHPSILKAIAVTTTCASIHGVPVAVCGEMGGDPVAVRALLGLGVDHLSMNAQAIGPVKRSIRGADILRLGELIRSAIGMATAAETRELFSE